MGVTAVTEYSLILNAHWFVVVSIMMFGFGVFGIMTQKSGIKILMSVELMMNASVILFVTFATQFGQQDGYLIALFIIAIAAAEAALGLAILVNVFRVKNGINVDQVDVLRW